MDLDAIWQVCLCGPMTHCVTWGLTPPLQGGHVDKGVELVAKTCKIFHIAAKPSVLCCHLANGNEELGGLNAVSSPFCKITLAFVCFHCRKLA